MDRTQFEKILASLDEKSLPELKELADLLLTRIAGVETEEEHRSRERFEAWKTPWYSLTIVSMTAKTPEEKALLVKQLRDVLHCELPEALKIMRSLPYEIVSRMGEYPLDCREKFRPLVEALEALGFVVEEDYHFGHYA